MLCPEYLNLSHTLYETLMMDFGDQLTIIKTISFENDIQDPHFDLLITAIPVASSSQYLTVLLPPLPMSYDKNKIINAITKIRTKKSEILTTNLNFYFNKNLFYIQDKAISKTNIINELSQKMINFGYVTDNFLEEVWKRVNISLV